MLKNTSEYGLGEDGSQRGEGGKGELFLLVGKEAFA